MSLLVETKFGRVQGVMEAGGVRVFRGIPYAAAPIGALRFRPPQPPRPWTDVRDATKIGLIAPQAPSQFQQLPEQSEDCLNLNVYAPTSDARNLPVLFYIHGGAFIGGSGASSAFSGEHLVREHNIVLVTINYRLGVLGFPPFQLFGDDTPANLGLLDQVQALHWVKDNIAAFGGNPDNVTPFGYSAGGWSVAALMCMTDARGLFHRAVPQSSCNMYAMRKEAQRIHTKTFLEALAQPRLDPEVLAKIPVSDLLRAQAAVIAKWQEKLAQDQAIEVDFPFTPVNDGVTLSEHPLTTISRGKAADIPVLIGTTEEELGSAPFRLELPWMREMYTRASIERALANFSNDREARRIFDTYAQERAEAREDQLVGFIRSDWLYRVPAIRVAEGVAARSGRAWMYRFDGKATAANIGISTHATDMTYWFGTMDGAALQAFLFGRAPTPSEKDASRQMMADLAGFARDGQCSWPAYNSTKRTTRLYGADLALTDDPGGRFRALWPEIIPEISV